MNQTWKAIVVLFIGSSLMACSTTGKPPASDTKQQKTANSTANDKKPQYGHVSPSEEVVKASPKPKPQPKKKVAKVKHTSDGKTILGSKEWVHIPGLEEVLRLESILGRKRHRLVH